MGKKKKLKRRIRELQTQLRQAISSHATDLPVTASLAPACGPLKLEQVDGVRFATAWAEVKPSRDRREDVMLAFIAPLCAVAGVYTRSSTRSAAVLDCETKLKRIQDGRLSLDQSALLVNSGNANAFTGKEGADSVAQIADAVALKLGVGPNSVFTSSTGVIGEPLPSELIVKTIDELTGNLSATNVEKAAQSIMTTDTFPKGESIKVQIGEIPVTITGFAKGSGMIAPDMATMLAYIFTDARIHPDTLQSLVAEVNEDTFNSITIDGDTSTSDTLMVFATGAADNHWIQDRQSEAAQIFARGLTAVMTSLARQIVLDGEGATKFIEVNVSGALDREDGRRVARAIANSPLVKTAISGEDANWGRIVMAVGKSGAQADRDKLKIWFGDILVAENGRRADEYSEKAAQRYMQEREIVITVDLGLGGGVAKFWTCDFSHGYISINADYRS